MTKPGQIGVFESCCAERFPEPWFGSFGKKGNPVFVEPKGHYSSGANHKDFPVRTASQHNILLIYGLDCLTCEIAILEYTIAHLEKPRF